MTDRAAALKALDRIYREFTEGDYYDLTSGSHVVYDDIAIIRAALAQQAEPVAWRYLVYRADIETGMAESYDYFDKGRPGADAELLYAAPQAAPSLWRTGMTEAETDAALAAHPPEQPAAIDSEREECARWLDEQVKRLERDDIFGERRTRLVQAARLLRGKP